MIVTEKQIVLTLIALESKAMEKKDAAQMMKIALLVFVMLMKMYVEAAQ